MIFILENSTNIITEITKLLKELEALISITKGFQLFSIQIYATERKLLNFKTIAFIQNLFISIFYKNDRNNKYDKKHFPINKVTQASFKNITQ